MFLTKILESERKAESNHEEVRSEFPPLCGISAENSSAVQSPKASHTAGEIKASHASTRNAKEEF